MVVLRNIAITLFAVAVIAVSGYAVHVNDRPYPGAGDVSAPTQVHVTQAAFIGDASTQGKGATNTSTEWVSLVAKHEGWDALNFGRAGTGYVTTAPAADCGYEACLDYTEMIPSLEQYDPTIIVVSSGQNDFAAWQKNPTATANGITTFYAKLRASFPAATIYSIGPATPAPTVAPYVNALAAAVQKAADGVHAKYISLLDPDVLKQSYLLADHEHVNDQGHAAIAARVEQGIDG